MYVTRNLYARYIYIIHHAKHVIDFDCITSDFFCKFTVQLVKYKYVASAGRTLLKI